MQTVRELGERHAVLGAEKFAQLLLGSPRILEKFPGELRASQEVLEWLNDFIWTVKLYGPVRIVHHLVQMGLENPHHADHLLGAHDNGEPITSWFKHYQWQYNTAIWEVLMSQKGLLGQVRRVLLADLKVTSDRGDPNSGKIALHAYEQALLDYFLKPKGPAWCIAPTWQTPELLDKLNI